MWTATSSRRVGPFSGAEGSIVYSLVGILVLVGLAPLAAGLWRIIGINREALATSAQESQLLLAHSTAEKVDLTVEALGAELERVVQMIETHRVGDVLETLLDDRIRYAIHVGGSPARATAVGHVPAALREPVMEEIERARLSQQAAAGVGGGARLSAPLLDAELEQVVFLLSVPVVDSDGATGVLAGVVDLNAIWRSVTPRGGGVVYAVDDQGTVIATTHSVQIVVGRIMTDAPLVRRFLESDGRSSETMPFDRASADGSPERVLASYAGSGPGWGIFVEAELDQVYSPISRMVRTTLTSALAVLLVAAAGATFVAFGVSRPISRLATASRAYARRDFSARVAVRSRNEIGELAATFNAMADEIGQHIDELREAAVEKQELFEGTILALAEAIDAKDPYTRGHSVRVNRYSMAIADELGLDAAERNDLHVGSLLHDVGKIGIDDAILKKPGKLTSEEFAIIKGHATLGANIMARIPQMERILPALRWHHERMDGSGYPDGLRGDQIPRIARIVAVADTFDAVTSDRSYQTTRNFDHGLELLIELRSELDAEVVAAFVRAYEAGTIRAPEPARPRHEMA